MPERLDNKYDVIREITRDEWMRSVEATDSTGKTVRIDWFFVVDPKSRANYHRYRTAIKNVASPLLLEATSRPGAYYTVWEILEGTEAAAWLVQHPKDQGFRSALIEAAQVMGSYGFALSDGQFIALQGAKGDVKPALSCLHIADRSSEEIENLNQKMLETSKANQSRGKMPVLKAKPGSKPVIPAVTEPAPTLVPEPPVIAAPLAVSKSAIKAVSSSTVAPLVAATPKPSLGQRILAFFVRTIPGAIALAGVIYFGAQATRQFLEPPTVTVPNVVGKTLAEAAKILSEARLTPRPVEGSDQSKVRDTILTQNPAPGSNITEQRVVEITVNQPRALLMPSLAGKTLAEARIALKEAKLKEGRIARVPAPEGTARDYILGQNPAPQTEVVRGHVVTLLVAGPRAPEGKTFIPDLTGLNTEDAKTVIKLAKLRLVLFKTQISNLPYGTVLAQTPAADTIVDLESDATLTVAVAGNAARPVIPQPVRPLQPTVTTQPNTQTTNNQPDPQQNTPTNNNQPDPQQNTPTTNNQPDPQQNTPTNNTDPNTLPTPQAPSTTPEKVEKPETTTPTTTQPNNTPNTPAVQPTPAQPATPAPIEARNESFSYDFPSDVPNGLLEIRVTDLDGERVVYGPQLVAAGQNIGITFAIRAEPGKASIVVIIDGVPKSSSNR